MKQLMKYFISNQVSSLNNFTSKSGNINIDEKKQNLLKLMKQKYN